MSDTIVSHPIISFVRYGLLLGALAGSGAVLPCGCDTGPAWPDGGLGSGPGQGQGKLAMSWTLDGAYFDQARCEQQGIDYMEVEVDQVDGPESVGYTQIRCDLDRYSLSMTPEGNVRIEVDGVGTDRSGQPCLRAVGTALSVGGAAFPDKPTPVPLHLVSQCR